MVTIPKTITLDSNKTSKYSVKVEGDIPSDKNVYVTPVDAISETDTIDFYMHDKSTKNPKNDVVATINQNKETWDFEEVANSVEETNNTISAPNLSAGEWSGTFNFNINLKAPHKHTYTSTITKEATCTEKGVKTFTCVDGDDSYTEEIPIIGHKYGNFTYTWSSDKSTCTAKRVCVNDASHVETETVNATSTITKEATCTTTGTKTYTTTFKNSVFAKQTSTTTIPAKGHNYVKGVCTNCGAENYGEDVTLTSDNLVTYGIATSGDVVIPSVVMSSDGVWHKIVEIKDSTFRNCTSLTSIEIPNSITSIGYNAFYGCSSLTSIDIPNSVTSIGNFAFNGCYALIPITIPNSVRNIEFNAFNCCSNLASVTYKGTTYTNKQELTNALTSNGVTLGNNIFAYTKLS